MNTPTTSTIAAIATAAGDGGISIVRVSGPDSIAIADDIFRGPGAPLRERRGGTFVHGFITSPQSDAGKEDVDEVILLVYRAPHSYTREDVVEIQGHGGRIAAQRVLAAVLAAGAEPAQPGEFTKRAFLNGRIDLVEAEAVADLISARSERAAAAALEQLEGRLSRDLNGIYDGLLHAAADLEASLDFDDGELPAAVPKNIAGAIGLAIEGMERESATWTEGHLLRDGALVAISGKPNVGKSTLLNCLLGKDRAIVTDIPGTTRDTIEEQIVLDGIPIRLVDTAGLRDAECPVEQHGVNRAQATVERADLAIWVLDASQPVTDAERTDIERLAPARRIVVSNKSDLTQASLSQSLTTMVDVHTSLTTGKGVSELKALLVKKLGGHVAAEPHAVISARHRDLLTKAAESARQARMRVMPEREDEFILAGSHLREALGYLGEITGRIYDEALLDAVFSQFCVGK